MSCLYLIYFIFLLFCSYPYFTILQHIPSKAENFFKLSLKPQKQKQQPSQIIEQKTIQELKEKNAKYILVIGDFVASSIANALNELFRDNQQYYCNR